MKNISSDAVLETAATSALASDDHVEVMENSAPENGKRYKNIAEILADKLLDTQLLDLMELQVSYSRVLEEIEVKFAMDHTDVPYSEVSLLIFKETKNEYYLRYRQVRRVYGDSEEIFNVFESIKEGEKPNGV